MAASRWASAALSVAGAALAAVNCGPRSAAHAAGVATLSAANSARVRLILTFMIIILLMSNPRRERAGARGCRGDSPGQDSPFRTGKSGYENATLVVASRDDPVGCELQ